MPALDRGQAFHFANCFALDYTHPFPSHSQFFTDGLQGLAVIIPAAQNIRFTLGQVLGHGCFKGCVQLLGVNTILCLLKRLCSRRVFDGLPFGAAAFVRFIKANVKAAALVQRVCGYSHTPAVLGGDHSRVLPTGGGAHLLQQCVAQIRCEIALFCAVVLGSIVNRKIPFLYQILKGQSRIVSNRLVLLKPLPQLPPNKALVDFPQLAQSKGIPGGCQSSKGCVRGLLVILGLFLFHCCILPFFLCIFVQNTNLFTRYAGARDRVNKLCTPSFLVRQTRTLTLSFLCRTNPHIHRQMGDDSPPTFYSILSKTQTAKNAHFFTASPRLSARRVYTPMLVSMLVAGRGVSSNFALGLP